MNPPYVALAVRSHFSFLQSTLSVPEIVHLAAQHDMPAVGLCDLGNLHGAVEFAVAARKAGIQPVLGAEVRWNHNPLWLFVENQIGYARLCQLLSTCARQHPSPPPPAADEAGSPETEPNSAPESRAAPPQLHQANLEDTSGLIGVARDPACADRFPGRFYRAITSRSDLNRYSANTHPQPALAFLPCAYARPEDRRHFDILECIRTLTLLGHAHPDKHPSGHYHFRPRAEVARSLSGHPELLAHTRELADRCPFTLSLGRPQFPAFRPPGGLSPGAFLIELVRAGARARYASGYEGHVGHQIETELRIIAEVGYEEYFLVVWDLLQTCRERGIEWITRGSAADSLVCYCLGISNVCPVRFDLYFQRFLNRERMALNKLPDIDVDFPHDRKDDVVDLLFAKYGPDHCAIVGGFSTYQARGAVADVAKVFGVSEYQIRRFTEHFPWGGSQGLAARLRVIPECADLPLDEEPYATALAMAESLDGTPRYAKMHPCGVVLSRVPMHHLTPTFCSPKGYPTTHFDMDSVEAIGLVKLDLLAQAGLAALRDTRALLRPRNIDVDLDRCELVAMPRPSPPPPLRPHDATSAPLVPAGQLPFDDPRVWDMIANGQTRGVHHIESPAMMSLCRMCQVRDIDTLIAVVSVIRPGAANEDKKREFARRCQGQTPPVYPHPSLESCLRSTFGLVVYEEHILQICAEFAGLPAGRADVLRRCLVKDRMDQVADLGREFTACARQRGRTDPQIAEVWTLLTSFHGYAFCKAHSTAYGVEAYQSAWLKQRFPAEFMAAILTQGKGFYRPLVYVLECHRLGIPLQPPSVNRPGPGFRVEPASPTTSSPRPGCFPFAPPRDPTPPAPAQIIRVPITAIAHLTRTTCQRVQEEHARAPFRSLADVATRVLPSHEELETLARAGALDEFGQSRCTQFWEIQHWFGRHRASHASSQPWLLPPTPWQKPDEPGPTAPDSNPESALPSAATALPPGLVEPTRLQRLQAELELLGFPASGHPLELYPGIAWDTYCPVARLGEFVHQNVTLCGLVIEDRIHHQATGEPMKFLSLADWTGIVETELFARTYKNYGLATVRYPLLEVTGRVEPFENGRGHTLRVLRAGPPRTSHP